MNEDVIFRSLFEGNDGVQREWHYALTLKNAYKTICNAHVINNAALVPGAIYISLAIFLLKLIGIEFNEFSKIVFLRPYFLADHNVDLSLKCIVEQKDTVLLSFFYENEISPLAILEVECAASFQKMQKLGGVFPEGKSLSADEIYVRLGQSQIHIKEPLRNILGGFVQGNEVNLKIENPVRELSQITAMAILFEVIFHGALGSAMDLRYPFLISNIDQIAINWHRLIQCPTLNVVYKRKKSEMLWDIDIEADEEIIGVLDGVYFLPKKKRDHFQVNIVPNFYASPLAATFSFLADRLDVPVKFNFQNANQISHFLVSSKTEKGQGGLNIILLKLEDWFNWNKPISLSSQSKNISSAGEEIEVLPNGLKVSGINNYETSHLYREIFLKNSYLKHGIKLNDNSTVVGVGGNIGMFDLYIKSQCPTAKIYSFEPIPAIYEKLKRNFAQYEVGISINAAIAGHDGFVNFRYYPKSTVFSSSSVIEQPIAELKKIIENQIGQESSIEDADSKDYIEQYIQGRLEKTEIKCTTVRLNTFVLNNEVAEIDLLKIDAEGLELEIIESISKELWAKIKQVVVEAHGEDLDRIVALLVENKFNIHIEQDALFLGTALTCVYASKEGLSVNASPARLAFQENLDFFKKALSAYKINNPNLPIWVCICPSHPSIYLDSEIKCEYDRGMSLLKDELVKSEIAFYDEELLLKNMGKKYYSESTWIDAGIPYKEEAWVHIALDLFRKVSGHFSGRFKLISIDCDNTLWQGICSEGPVSSLSVMEAHQALQKTLLKLKAAGFLLAICSKNDIEDVRVAFNLLPEMILKKTDIAFWKVNWEKKSDNLKSLAREANLGLDSFIHIDDNHVETFEIRLNAPDVTAISLPNDLQDWPNFIKHLWCFDILFSTTKDGEARTSHYLTAAKRKDTLQAYSNIRGFLNDLNLKIEIVPLSDLYIDRVVELSYRTNQFNAAPKHLEKSKIKQFLLSEGSACYTIHVADKFGDYGCVGSIFIRFEAEAVVIHNWYLSCRIFDLGVEYQVLRFVANIALENGKNFMKIAFSNSGKNRKAYAFLEALIRKVGGQFADRNYVFLTHDLLGVHYAPDEQEPSNPLNDSMPLNHTFKLSASSYEKAASKFSSARKVYEAIFGLGHHVVKPGEDAVTAQIKKIWESILENEISNMNESFFNAGGESLDLIRMLSAVEQAFGLKLRLIDIYQNDTPEALSGLIKELSGTTL